MEKIFSVWEKKWTLVNPKPELPSSDNLLVFIQTSVVLGSVILSGTRTGNVVSDIGSFADFGSKIGYLGLSRGVFTAIEALLAFVTFDAGILLAGYLTGDEKANRDWYWGLLIFAMIPALFANALPGLGLINEQFKSSWQVIVDITVGICTPAMAFVSGRVLGAVRNARRCKKELMLSSWQKRKKNAWLRSAEYRGAVGKAKKVSKKPKVGNQDVLSLISENGGTTVIELAEQLGKSQAEIIAVVSGLSRQGKVLYEGSRVSLPDF